MTFPAKLVRLQFGGTLYTTEQWSTGLHFTTDGPIDTAQSLAAAVEAMLASLVMVSLHDTANLGFIKFNEIDHQTGKYVDTGQTNAKYYSPEQGYTSTTSGLPQASTCVTLTTAKSRGRGHSGRMYLPGHGAVGTTGHVGSSLLQTIGTSVAVMINAITTFNPELTPVIWSKLADTVTPITGVKVGSIVDTQRRRRSSLKETYTISNTPVV